MLGREGFDMFDRQSDNMARSMTSAVVPKPHIRQTVSPAAGLESRRLVTADIDLTNNTDASELDALIRPSSAIF